MSTNSNKRIRRLEVRDLSVKYGDVPALEKITLELEFGRSLAVVGPNGAGKSTFIKAVAGLVSPGSGQLRWRPDGGKGGRGRKGDIAYLAQQGEVDWSFPLTVRSLVELGRYPHTGWWRKFGRTDYRKVKEALASMDLEDLAERQIGALSGGQKQRAFLARALAQEAGVLLLDEPFGGLDLPSQEMLSNLLAKLASDGRLIIVSHHDLDTIADIFDDVLLLNRCKLAFGPVAETLTTGNLERCFNANSREGKPPVDLVKAPEGVK